MADIRKWHHVSTVDKLPKTKQFAILTGSSIAIPGDERSRTNPGHGYPASNEPIIELKVTDDEAEWKAEIANLSTGYFPKPFRAFIIQPVDIGIEVSVTVKGDKS